MSAKYFAGVLVMSELDPECAGDGSRCAPDDHTAPRGTQFNDVEARIACESPDFIEIGRIRCVSFAEFLPPVVGGFSKTTGLDGAR